MTLREGQLALVGEALAATHNPRALLPVILNVITEATGARGGQLVHDGREIGRVGEVESGRESVEFDLSAGDETRATKLVLHPPEGGFAEETTKLAEWLSSQAAIALENARLHDIVQEQAMTDELTGLVNRRRFLAALESEIGRARRLDGPVSVVLADLDDFKLINDRFGHHAGDEVLQAFADLLRAHGRDVDIAGRLGGEEFALLLPETDVDGAVAGAERLCRSLSHASDLARRRPRGVDDGQLRGCRARRRTSPGAALARCRPCALPGQGAGEEPRCACRHGPGVVAAASARETHTL